MMRLTPDDVVIDDGFRIVAAPMLLGDDIELFVRGADPLLPSFRIWLAIPEFWQPLCAELSAERNRRDLADYHEALDWIARAEAGDEAAIDVIKRFRSAGIPIPPAPPEPVRVALPSGLYHQSYCQRCGRPMLASRPWYKLCSEHCRSANRQDSISRWTAKRSSRAKPREDRVCKVCGATFQPKRDDAQYCSGRCRVRAHRAGSATAT